MIRLVSVIGHGVDLIPHFINHYKNYVDEIQLVTYETDEYPDIHKRLKDLILDYDNVKIVFFQLTETYFGEKENDIIWLENFANRYNLKKENLIFEPEFYNCFICHWNVCS